LIEHGPSVVGANETQEVPHHGTSARTPILMGLDRRLRLSVHTYAFGPGNQLVHVCPELSAFQEELFREICGLPARNEAQVLPHGHAFEMDDVQPSGDMLVRLPSHFLTKQCFAIMSLARPIIE
jgi:hypothetical protein